MTTEVERWVDRVLDEYEAWRESVPRTMNWRSYVDAHLRRPESIKALIPSVIQDAMIWLHDGGMENAHIATILGIPDSRAVRDALAGIEDEYVDE